VLVARAAAGAPRPVRPNWIWPLQFIETGIFLGLAAALAGFCF